MTDAELADLVATLRSYQTDLRHVEAKRAKGGLPKSVRETLSAFSNSPEGGVIVLGLDEESGFTATGVDNPKQMQQEFGSLCADQMEPPVRAVVTLHRLDGQTLLIAEVPELPLDAKPCYYKGAGLTNGAYVRTADGDRRLSAYEVQVMLASRGQPREDEAPVPEASMDDLDATALAAFMARVRQRRPRFARRSDEELLRLMKVLVPAGADDRLVPSLAGLLVFGNHPQQFFPKLYLQFISYPGLGPGEPGADRERFLDDARCEGSIVEMLLQALAALGRNVRRTSRVKGVFREDRLEYPEEAVREAVVNALAHRDLSPLARGSAVQMNLFPDRLAIVNPGGLFGPATVERLGVDGVSSARNQVLMQLLEDAVVPGTRDAVAENRGSGIGAMIHALRAAGLSPPRFDNQIATFRVTFPRHVLADDETLHWLAAVGAAELTESQRTALALMREGEAITNSRYRQISGQDSRVVTRELGELVKLGLAQMVSGGRWTSYRLAPGRGGLVRGGTNQAAERGRMRRGSNQAAERSRARRADRRPEILRLLDERGELSRAQIADALRLRRAGVNHWLKRLRTEGRVVLTAERETDPNARYRLAPVRRTSGG